MFYIRRKAKLYGAFINYEKAFDMVIQDAFWIKLFKTGICCKRLKMIQAIYQNVGSCFKAFKTKSYYELFDSTLGVKQGEPISLHLLNRIY